MNNKEKVTVVVAVLNEEEHVKKLLKSLLAQQRLPDSIVFADGGSSDATLQNIMQISASSSVEIRIINVPGKIAVGRNSAISIVDSSLIAVTDADCVPSPNWLQSLVTPLLSGARASSGSYEVRAETSLERAISSFSWVRQKARRRFLPSHRSVAFRKSLWEEIGGYREDIDSGEDTLFDIEVLRRCEFAQCLDAVVFWRPRGTLCAAIRQQLYYGAGDGQSRIQVAYHVACLLVALSEIAIWAPLASVRAVGFTALLSGIAYFIVRHIGRFGFKGRDIPLVALLFLLLPPVRVIGYALGVCGVSVRKLLARS